MPMGPTHADGGADDIRMAPTTSPVSAMNQLRLLPLLVAVPLVFELGRSSFLAFWLRYVYLPIETSATSANIPAGAMDLGSSLLSFATVPCALFVVLFYLGKRFDLEGDISSIVVSLFVGGAIGVALEIFPQLVAVSGTDFTAF